MLMSKVRRMYKAQSADMLARVIIAYTRLYREIYAMHIYVHYLF